MRFVKMNGLGNNYIFVFDKDIPKNCNLNCLSKRLSDVHFGIGGDGLVVLSKSQTADIKMSIFNNDGSEANLCGNALRCIGKLLYDGFDKKELYKVETKSGIKDVKVFPNSDGSVSKVGFFVNDVRFFEEKEQVIVKTDDDLSYIVSVVDTGNYHAIRIKNEFSSDDFDVAEKISEAPVFSGIGGANVHTVVIKDRQNIDVKVYERGSKTTYACGSGAVAVAFCLYRLSAIDNISNIRMTGGTYSAKIDNDSVFICGNVATNYKGEIEL